MNKDINETIGKIEIAFARLLGDLCIMKKLDTYIKIEKDLTILIDRISSWGATFQKERNLNFISREELLFTYEKLDNIKDNYLYDSSIGIESEYSDEIVIWMLELMNLRKKIVELELK